jgi:hypothetical protein
METCVLCKKGFDAAYHPHVYWELLRPVYFHENCFVEASKDKLFEIYMDYAVSGAEYVGMPRKTNKEMRHLFLWLLK